MSRRVDVGTSTSGFVSPMIEEMSSDEIHEFVLQQKVGRVGCHTAGETYVVPVIYAWHDDCFYV
ncbi:MAG TPA: pyridoxamine 5'-phosphate oxidase family protein, partial [Acidimicrobiales bacterium]|nr:pyridoxamine 5'-phosphate oxidase family protein [Acidimicrobiales bacterium]